MFSLNPIVSFMYLLFRYLAHKCSHWFLSLLFIVSVFRSFSNPSPFIFITIFYSNMSLIFFIVCKFFLRYLKILFFESCVSWLNIIYMSIFIFNSVFNWIQYQHQCFYMANFVFLFNSHFIFLFYLCDSSKRYYTKLSLEYQRIFSCCLF